MYWKRGEFRLELNEQRRCTNVYVVLHMHPGTANADLFWLGIVAKLTGEYGDVSGF